MKLEEKLVSLRKAKGLSQMKLAEKMNVSRQAISRWETGAAIPSSENLKYLSDLYSVSLDYLLSDSADGAMLVVPVALLLTKVILLMPALHVMKLVTIMVAPISTTIRILRSAS